MIILVHRHLSNHVDKLSANMYLPRGYSKENKGILLDPKKVYVLRPALMHTKNLYENGPNPFFFFGTKNMSEGHLMHTVLVCYVFDKPGQACLCG